MRRKEQTEIAINFQELFGTHCGQVVLKRLSVICKENEPSFVQGESDFTAYNEGLKGPMRYIRVQLAKDVKEERPKFADNERKE